jgi:hypothetical protein
VSSRVSAGVGDCSPHKQFPSHVKERQTSGGSLGSHDGHDLVNPLWLRRLVASPAVHLGGLSSAAARRRRLDAESFQQAGKFRTGAACRRLTASRGEVLKTDIARCVADQIF